MFRGVIRIGVVTLIGGIVIVSLTYVFVRTYGVKESNNINPSTSNTEFIQGEVLVTLKPYTNVDALDNYIKQHPELVRKKSKTLSSPSIGTLTLKGHQKITQKAISLGIIAQDDPEIIAAEQQLQTVYERLKKDPLLKDSNIWNKIFQGMLPQKGYFGVIHYFFKEGVSQAERKQFFQSYPELEIVEDKEESPTYTVTVPKGKERYWEQKLSSELFVKVAWLNQILKINNNDGVHIQ